MCKRVKLKKRLVIYINIFALLFGALGALQPTTTSAAIGWDDLRNLQVLDKATNGNVLINTNDGKKFYYIGVARNNTLLDFGLDLALYEREDKALYAVINPENGRVRGYAVTGENAYEYKFDLSNVFGDYGVGGLNLFDTKIDVPKDYYIVSGKILGKLDLKDFKAKTSTLNDASISIRVGAANAWLTQADVKEDGTFSLSNSIINNVGANSIIVDTGRVKDILIYGYYKDVNGQVWEGKKTLNLATDFTRDPNNPQGMLYNKGSLDLQMAPTPNPTLSQQNIVTASSPFDIALSNAIKTFAKWAETTIRWAVNSVTGLLGSTADYVVGKVGCVGSACGMIGPWTVMRNIGLTLMVMALIIIAFANVLQIDIEQYGLNRMIPKIIISIVMAFFSWIIVVFFFDFTKALQDQAKGLINGPDGLVALQKITITTTSPGDAVLGAATPLLLIAIAIGAVICMIVLLFTLLARVVMLSFLLAVAPLAFILNIVPFTSNLYKQWWTEFWKWMFMGPVAVIIIALGSVIAGSVQGTSGALNTTLTPDSVGPNGGQTLIGFLILAASLYMAATLPMQWGGKIMQGWGKVGKWGRDNLLGGKYVKQGWQDFNKARADRGMLKYNELRTNLANKVPGGKMLTGTNKAQAAALAEGLEKTYESTYSRAGANDLIGEFKKSSNNPAKQRALAKIMQSKYGDASKLYAEANQLTADGNWASNDPATRKVWEEAAKGTAASSLTGLMMSDRGFRNFMSTENQELSMAIAENASSTSNPVEMQMFAAQLYGGIASGNAGKNFSGKSDKFIKGTTKAFQSANTPEARAAYIAASKSEDDQEVIPGVKVNSDEGKIIALKRAGLTEYQAIAFIQAQNMAKRWKSTMSEGERTKELTRSSDKVAGAIKSLDEKVDYIDTSQPNDPSDTWTI